MTRPVEGGKWVGVEQGIVKKSGAWYTYEGEQLGQGRENAKQFLTDNPEVMVEIDGRIRSQLGIGDLGSEAEAADTDLGAEESVDVVDE